MVCTCTVPIRTCYTVFEADQRINTDPSVNFISNRQPKRRRANDKAKHNTKKALSNSDNMETTGEQETDVEEMDFGSVEPGINLYKNATFADRFKDDYSYISGDVISLSEKPMDDSNQSLVRSYSKEVDQVEELISSNQGDPAIKDDRLVEAERNTQVEGKLGSEVRKNHNDALEKTRPNPVAVEYCQTHTPHSCTEHNPQYSQCPGTGRKRRLSESSTLATDCYITTTPPSPHLSKSNFKSNFKSLSPPLANLGSPSKDHAKSLTLPGSCRALQTLEPSRLQSTTRLTRVDQLSVLHSTKSTKPRSS
ncbi:hypothetical protein DL95DRAFT_399529 [Leptodontidium sp. 2 PMI_412]|nr:hypothetical protein DL95DRAFT_399529 [Leptodontidium sp. 2 PMI_412]